MQHDVAPADGTAAPDTTDPNAANARPGAAPLADRPTQRADAATTAAPVEGIAAATEPAQGDDTDTTTSADAPGGAEAGTAPTTVDAPAPGAHRVTATADTSRRGGEGAPSSNADGNRNHPPTASPDDVGRPSQLTPLTTHGARHLSISMEHEQLGAIRIGAAEDRGTINISLQADDASAGAVLREHATRLSDHLALSGVAVGQVEVRHGDGFAHRHAQSTPAEFMPDAGRTGTDDDPSPTGPRLIRPSLDPDRRVDLLL
ncbi:MAG: flagellar hook-length control protein FliK [Ilumatobacteraceae bacterium]